MHYCNVSPETRRYYFTQQGGWGAEKSFHPEYVNKIIQRHFPLTPGES